MARWSLSVQVVSLGLVLVPRLAGAQTFSNPAAITINDNAIATPYPSNITVSGVTAPIGKVTVTLTGLSHTFASDVNIMLVSPTGSKFVLFGDVGGMVPVSGATITLDDAAANLLPPSTALTSGTYRPSATSPDAFPAPAPAPVAGDRAVPAGTATFASQFGGQLANGVWSLYVYDDFNVDTGSISGGWSLTITPAAPATAGSLIISEFRVRGPSGANDEFIEIYNTTADGHVVAALSGTGYGIAASDGTTRCSIPNGTVIPRAGHYLCTNSLAYSLGAYASGDATYATDIPDNAGIAIFNNNTGGGSYSLANRLDAVGSTSEANTTYKEGTGYPALTAFSIDYAFTRRPAGGCNGSSGVDNCNSLVLVKGTGPVITNAPVDSNNNAADFIFVDTNGTSAGAGQRLGAPGPQKLTSPVVRDGEATLKTSKFDNCFPLEGVPNLITDLTSIPAQNSTFGSIELRRTFTNTTGTHITRLRFRVVDISTFPSISGANDFRLRTTANTTDNVDRAPCGNGTTVVTVLGTTLEQPPSQPNGGGYNSTFSVGSVTSGTPILSGASVNVRFLLGMQQTGFGRFCVVPEALPDVVGEPFCYIGKGTGGSYAPADVDNDHIADIPLYNRATGVWSILKSGGAFTSSSIVNWGGAGYLPVPGDYDGDNRLDAALYKETTGTWTVLTSSSNFTQALTISWGGPGYKAVPGDYDGDGQTDMAVYFAPTGLWYILRSTSGFTTSLNVSWGGSAYTPVGGLDFDSDKKSDLTIYNESLGTWYVLQSSTAFTTAFSKGWGGVGYTLVPGDYDGDGKADFGLYRRSTGLWYILKSVGGYTTSLIVSWGGPGFVPMPADYDGDGKIDLGLYQAATTRFQSLMSASAYSLGGAIVQTFGTVNDVPISSAVLTRNSREIDEGDFDGDFTSDLTVYNTTTGVWSILKSSSNFTAALSIGWGGSGYSAVPGDYDGDGKGDLGLYQGSTGTWLVLLSASNYTTTLSKSNGGPGYVPVAGDYDGDGKTDIVTYNTTTGVWFGLKSSTNYTTTINVGWGGTGYTATPGDFDGDGKQDLAVYQGSTGNWLILTSSSNYTSSIARNFGGAGYVPVAADHDGDGITDFAVYQTSSGIWTMLKSSSGNTLGFTVAYGGPAFTPVAGDWDGDGRADVGVYDAAGNWSILLSNGNYTTSLGKSWGGAGYTPVPVFP